MNMLAVHYIAYEDDYVGWAEQQADLLRARQVDQLDIEQLIMELDDIVRNHRRELTSRLRILIMHLLKCEFQPDRKSSSWVATLATQRAEIELLLDQNPCMKPQVADAAQHAYPIAVRVAAKETGLSRRLFPAALPYSLHQLLDYDFEP